jgi:hypothetical protein
MQLRSGKPVDLMSHRILAVFAILVAALPLLAEPQCVLALEKLPRKGETVVWSPLFQASWDKLSKLHAGRLEKVVPENGLITGLNQFQWNEHEVMPKIGYAVFAGRATPEFAQATAMEIKNRFGVEMTPSTLPGSPRGNAVYGILCRDLLFQRQFFRARAKPLEFKDGLGATHQVSFFGTAGELSDHYGNCVKVLACPRGPHSIHEPARWKYLLCRGARSLDY